MLHVICFSHKRQLQLHGYLTSLYRYVMPEAVTVIYPPSNAYETVKGLFGAVNWMPESTFDKTLRDVVGSVIQPFVLFGCDDVVFTRHAEFEFEDDVIGYSLRLGRHINGARELKWDWTKASHHWGYPFELTGTVYKTYLVRALIDVLPGITGPNELECVVNEWLTEVQCPQLMQRNPTASCISQDVNQVAVGEYISKGHRGTGEHEVNNLERLYQEGKRLDWEFAIGAIHDDVWTGDKFWRLR